MARPQRCRRVCCEPEYNGFSPDGILTAQPVTLSVDEYEVLRLVDYEHKTHEQCSRMMDISRTTVTEIYDSARYKVSDCLVNGKRMVIDGGHYRVCDGAAAPCCGQRCGRGRRVQGSRPEKKEENRMRIAVTYENGQVFQHFGHTESFKFYDVENGSIVKEQVVPTNGSGHGALAGFLKQNQVDTLICGGIGGGAQTALAKEGIQLYGGASGSTDDAVRALLEGRLVFDPNVHCDHHEHHGEGEHQCGSHGCGEHSCH